MRSRATMSVGTATLLALLATAAKGHAKSTFVLNNTDSAGVGLNDSTPATPIGGNSGTTVGQQRINAFQYALDLWGKAIDSAVPIVVDASFSPFDCAANNLVPLGRAAPTGEEYGVPGLAPNMLYPEALADRIVGYDLNPGTADIRAEFNGNLIQCLPGYDWYYGFDGKSGSNSDLVTTVLHEIAHGLGFGYLPDPATGELLAPGMVDPYFQHLLDTQTGRHFDVMSTAERLSSIGNARHIVWDGQYVTQAAATYLAAGAPSVGVNPAPSGFLGALLEANFGPRLPTQALTGPLATGNPTAGCSALANLSGSIALFSGGACSPINMADYAQKAGALAAIVADADAITPPASSIEVDARYLNMFTITIPTVEISKTEADLLIAASSSGLSVTLSANPAQRVGADPTGKVYIYASKPTTSASTMSHWDPLTRPNLLLEPTSTPDNPRDLTMEKALLRDIGWEPFCGNGRLDATEECDNGSANSDTQPNACRMDCTKAKCGDQVVDTGEQCDNGSSNSDTQPDACRAHCTRAQCGDQVIDTGEECDDGTLNGTLGACQKDCKLPANVTASTSGSASCGCRVRPLRSESSGLALASGIFLLLARRRRAQAAARQ